MRYLDIGGKDKERALAILTEAQVELSGSLAAGYASIAAISARARAEYAPAPSDYYLRDSADHLRLRGTTADTANRAEDLRAKSVQARQAWESAIKAWRKRAAPGPKKAPSEVD